jgi:signal peptidase I
MSRLRQVGREVVQWLQTLTSAAVYATLIVTFGFQVARVEGRSMEPTLQDQDRLVVNKLAYRMHDPEIGDVVMLLHPSHPEQTLVKRVVAAPGDTIGFEAGVLVRNGVPEAETFVPPEFRQPDERPAILVPDGFYYVLGDHRSNSTDSRSFGPVPRKYILGRVQVRWWPIPAAKRFEP